MSDRTLAKIGVRGSLADERASRRAEILRERKAAYALVDARDKGRCRACGHRVSPTAVWHIDKLERHHITSRRYAGTETSANIVTLCAPCHKQIPGTLKLSGNADRLGELVVKRLVIDTWWEEPEFLLRERPVRP
jgi:5-methylcytosine-specific restriction endonuclease McrA